MEQKKIRINDWGLINRLISEGKNVWVSGDLEDIDEVLVGIVPKIFYHYDIDKDSNMFVIVPIEYVDKVRDIVGKVAIIGTHSEYNEIIGVN